jgi:hypothetical protein
MPEELNMVDVWKMKLHELRLQQQLMKMDPKFSEEELNDLAKMIESARKEYAKALLEEQKENSNGKKL